MYLLLEENFIRHIFNIKRIPNLITIGRIIFSVLLVFVKPFSIEFYIIYLIAILSDMIDGFLARKFKVTSLFGSKLDSIADFILFLVIWTSIISSVAFSKMYWFSFIAVLCLRIISLIICYIKFHHMAILHSYMNKFVGFMCIAIPFIINSNYFNIFIWLIILVAVLSVMEEIIIHFLSSKLNTDIKGLFALIRNLHLKN